MKRFIPLLFWYFIVTLPNGTILYAPIHFTNYKNCATGTKIAVQEIPDAQVSACFPSEPGKSFVP